jgi:hypothetical protein
MTKRRVAKPLTGFEILKQLQWIERLATKHYPTEIGICYSVENRHGTYVGSAFWPRARISEHILGNDGDCLITILAVGHVDYVRWLEGDAIKRFATLNKNQSRYRFPVSPDAPP